MPQQFNNGANAEIHRRTTAQEILKDFPEGFDYLITGIGTGGHITGVSEVLKQHFPKLQTFAVEPAKSPSSAAVKRPPPAAGPGPRFCAGVLNKSILDGILLVLEEDAFAKARLCAQKEGIFVGISSGATLAALAQNKRNYPLAAEC